MQQTRTSGATCLESAAERIDSARSAALADLSETAIELSVEIARAILRREIDAGAYELERIVRETLEASGVERGNCVVHVHPDDFAQLQEVPFRSGTELESDTSVARGDVHVSTPRGLLVRETSSALASIRERLLQEHSS